MFEIENPIYQNLLVLALQGSDLWEKEFAHLDELVYSFASEEKSLGYILENDNFINGYKEATSHSIKRVDTKKDGIAVTKNDLKNISFIEDLISKIYICRSICKLKAKQGFPIKVFDFIDSGENVAANISNNKISYFKNSFADTAFNIFSRFIENAAAFYPQDFNAACEDVYYGKTSYCILPYESSEEGELRSFKRLIVKYDLCPVLTCSVYINNISAITKFVLLSKYIEKIPVPPLPPLPPLPKNFRTEEYLTIKLNSYDSETLNKVLVAAQMNGLVLNKVQSHPNTWFDDKYYCEVSFLIEKAEVDSFLMYLLLEIPQYSIMGLHTNIVIPSEQIKNMVP